MLFNRRRLALCLSFFWLFHISLMSYASSISHSAHTTTDALFLNEKVLVCTTNGVQWISFSELIEQSNTSHSKLSSHHCCCVNTDEYNSVIAVVVFVYLFESNIRAASAWPREVIAPNLLWLYYASLSVRAPPISIDT